MLTAYIRAAMRLATYELLADGEGFYGEISALPGVWANEQTSEACREQLQEVLAGWVILGLRKGYTIPIIDGIDLKVSVITGPGLP